MNDIEKFQELSKKAEGINRQIATLEGSRNEVLRQLSELGIEPDNLAATISQLEVECERLNQQIKQAVAELSVKIEETSKVLNG
ncbi:MAG: hypothetical protein FJ006_12030 [Chloroflexi bacterium]|nr:hypothetical protein [Chloroflexota bacterium]